MNEISEIKFDTPIERKLVDVLATLRFQGCVQQEACITDIAYDSRKAGKNVLFVCLKGAKADGHDYATAAYQAGSRIFAAERMLDLPEDALVLIFDDTRAALAVMSDNFFSHPSQEIQVIGVTGTKGKTTVTHMIKYALDRSGYKSGLIGTIGAFVGDKKYATANTTPESYDLNKLLRFMIQEKCKAVCVEVSSLGLKTHRVDKIDYAIGVFTNLSNDHIGGGEHESFEEYVFWKEQLFKHCALSIVNIDDPYSSNMVRASSGKIIRFGIDKGADYSAKNIAFIREQGFLGVKFECVFNNERLDVKANMTGKFTVYNALAAIAVLDTLAVPSWAIKEALENISVSGRAEMVRVSGKFDVLIDYAHNGVSFQNILETLREYEPKRLICLYGCVGDRAQIRRKEMGTVSGRLADISIITSDDPGYEDPAKICEEIAHYVEDAGGKAVKIVDREAAVHYALSILEEGDILVLLGKGHEMYQKIKGEKIYFSERACIQEYFNR